MSLLVDIGNSRIKWGIVKDSTLDQFAAHAYQSDGFSDLIKREWLHLQKPDRILLANVAGDEIANAVTEIAGELWSMVPAFAKVEAQRCGVMNAYSNLSQLGVDRWLALLAVWSHYHSAACIVDCGTALTIDVIDQKGQHQGGLIVPGPALMQDTLVKRTSDISVAVGEKYIPSLGVSTEECIRNGAGLAATALIDRVVSDMKRKYAEFRCVITGGAAMRLESLLEETFVYEPWLVLKGLALLRDDAQ